eukprot:scaffold1035_cov115-Cylindrotheca_fusiformis.AAC.6
MNRLVRRLSGCRLSKPMLFRGPSVGYRSPTGVGQEQHKQPLGFFSSLARPPSFERLSGSAAGINSEVEAMDHFQSDTFETVSTSRIFANRGANYGLIFDTRKLPKLKPSTVKRRLSKCKTYQGKEKSIRQSPWKLNRVCRLAAGLTLEEALTQLKFCDLKNAGLVASVLKRTSNLADIRHGLQVSQLEVAECFATKAMMLRRIKTMGRGRHGVLHHKFSHIQVVLREIDFPLRIYQQNSLSQKRKLLQHQHRAEQDAKAAKAKREEMHRMLKQQEMQFLEEKSN